MSTATVYGLGIFAFWLGLIVAVVLLCKAAAIGDCVRCGCECDVREDDPC